MPPKEDDRGLSKEELAALAALEGDDTPKGEAEAEDEVDPVAATIMAHANTDVASLVAKVTEGELKVEDLAKFAMLNADYTKKTTALSQQKKDVQTKAEELAAKEATLAERERTLLADTERTSEENQRLLALITEKAEEDPDMPISELFEEDSSVDSAMPKPGTDTRVDALMAKVAQLENQLYTADVKHEVASILDAAPDLVPSAKSDSADQLKVRAGMEAEIIARHFASDASASKPIAETAKAVLDERRLHQKHYLGLLSKQVKEAGQTPKREGAAPASSGKAQPRPLDKVDQNDQEAFVNGFVQEGIQLFEELQAE